MKKPINIFWKLTLLLMYAVISLSLAGCAGGNPPELPQESPAEPRLMAAQTQNRLETSPTAEPVAFVETEAAKAVEGSEKAVGGAIKALESVARMARPDASRQQTKLTVFIDAGHQAQGNKDTEPVYPGATERKAKISSGTRGVKTGKYEYELNLEVALKLRDKLTQNGYTVLMARDRHDVDISNVERATMANDANADIVIRIHADGSENPSTQGYSILLPGDEHIADVQMLSDSRRLGEYIHDNLQIYSDQRQPSRGLIVRNDLSGFNWLKVPGILLEMGFMTNPEEDQLMSTPEYQDIIVEALYMGIEQYDEDMP